MNISGQHVIVTGAASGMGATTAKHLASLGAKITLLDHNAEGVEQMATEIGGLGFACDVSNADNVESILAEAKDKQGTPRACINCAGIAPAQRVVGRDGVMPLDNFAKVINVNLVGSFNVLRIAASQMMADEAIDADGQRGVIINTASVAAFEGQIGQSAYSASKGGIVAMTLPLAREFAKFGIRVMTIAPGIIGTPMLLNMPQPVQDSLAASIPFPSRMGKPEEYAGLVEHIINNDILNGSVIRLDGAIRMQPK